MRKLLMLILVVLGVFPIFAQEDAIIDRVLNSTPPQEAYSSYTAVWTFKSGNVVAIDFAGMALELTSSIDATATIQTTLGDNPSTLALLTYTAEEADDTGVVSYTIEAEVRYVNDTLYVTATYTEGIGPYDIRGEWVIVDDLENFPEYDFLADLIQNFEMGSEDVDLESVLPFATGVTVEPTELENAVVDNVVFTFGWQGLENLLDMVGTGLSLDAENPIAAALIQELSNSDVDLLTFSLLLDDNDVQVGRATGVNIMLNDLDASVLDPTLEGSDATVNIELTSAEDMLILEANEVYPSLEVPEVQ